MEITNYATTGIVFFLFALFCAYWAQTTGRHPWLWFFLGWLFAPFTGVVLLYKNDKDRQAQKQQHLST